LLQLAHAASLIARANTVLQDDIAGYFRELDADLDGLMAATKKSSKQMFENLVKARTACNKLRIRFILIRFGVLVALLLVRGHVAARLRALPMIWGKINPMKQRVDEFEKVIPDAYKLLAAKDSQIRIAVRMVRAEKFKAAAKVAGSGDYDTKTPVIAAGLRRKLSATVRQIRIAEEAAKQLREYVKAGLVAYQNAKPGV